MMCIRFPRHYVFSERNFLTLTNIQKSGFQTTAKSEYNFKINVHSSRFTGNLKVKRLVLSLNSH